VSEIVGEEYIDEKMVKEANEGFFKKYIFLIVHIIFQLKIKLS
jgi:hypothetical protein